MAFLPTLEIPSNGTDEPQGYMVLAHFGVPIPIPLGKVFLPAPDVTPTWIGVDDGVGSPILG